MKKPQGVRLLLFFIFFLFLSPVWSQTAAEMEKLLEQKVITYDQAAFYILAVTLENPPADEGEAFAYAKERGWFSKKTQSGGSLTISDLSLLFMKAFNIKGGMMYRITGSRRYAFREMTDRGFISGRVYPQFPVSGEQFLQITGNVLTGTGEGK